MTLRELLAMAESRHRQLWGHTSSVMALIANVHRDSKKQRALRPEDFNPMARRGGSQPSIRAPGLGILKRVFVDRNAKATGDRESRE